MGDLVPTLPGIILLNGFGTHWQTYFTTFVPFVAAGLGFGLSFVVSGIVMLVIRHRSINSRLGLQIKGIDWRWFVAVGAIIFLAVFIFAMLALREDSSNRFGSDWGHWNSFVAAVTAGSGLGVGFFVSGIFGS